MDRAGVADGGVGQQRKHWGSKYSTVRVSVVKPPVLNRVSLTDPNRVVSVHESNPKGPMLPREPVLSGVRSSGMASSVYNQLPRYEPVSPTPWGAEQPKSLVHKVQSLLGSPGLQECVALSFLGPPVPRSCPAWKLWP